MDDARPAECGYSRDVSHMIMRYQMVLLVLTIFITVACYALIVISKRQEMMLETLLKQSGDMQSMLGQRLHETHCQAGSYRNGSGN
jgi:hypothetical protein